MSACELVLGGQKSGKSRHAEMRAAQWLALAPQRRATLIATARADDAEMGLRHAVHRQSVQRIARHRSDRAQRVPQLLTVEEPLDLAAALARHSSPDTLVVVDCLTLWLSNHLFPLDSKPDAAPVAALLAAVAGARGPLVFVSNEIGLGVIPMGAQVRAFVDALGLLHQQLAQHCAQVTLMVAGLPLAVKGGTDARSPIFSPNDKNL